MADTMTAIINKLRRSSHTQPIFGDRVAGVADASRAMDYASLDFPSLYVSPLSETAETQAAGTNENQQRVSQIWGVIVGLDARPDVRGQYPTHTLDAIRPALFQALYNWAPDKEHGNFWYDSLKLLGVSRAATFWLFGFGSYYSVCGAYGEGETEEQYDNLPDFDGANLRTDWLQPFDPGDPPSGIYDPKYPAPRIYGPDGRIESVLQVPYPGWPDPKTGKPVLKETLKPKEKEPVK